MSFQVITQFANKEFPLIAEGVYTATITKMEEKTRTNPFKGGQEETGIQIEFTFIDGDYSGQKAWKWFNPVLAPPKNGKEAAFRIICHAVMGRFFTPAELAVIGSSEDPLTELQRFLMNKNIILIMKNKTSSRSGKPYAYISDYMKSNNSQPTVVPQEKDNTVKKAVPSGEFPGEEEVVVLEDEVF